MQKKEYNKEKNIVIILCTISSNALIIKKITKGLLKEKLIACVTIIPNAISFYIWNKKIEKTNEKQLIIKTKKSLQNKTFKYIKQYHPYKTPELIVIPTIKIEKNYLSWIYNALK